MHPMPDCLFLHRAAPEISTQALVLAALDPSPMCSGMGGRPCLSRSERLAADGSERLHLLAPRWTQPEHERHLRHLGAAVPDMLCVGKASLVPSCFHRAAPDRSNFVSQR